MTTKYVIAYQLCLPADCGLDRDEDGLVRAAPEEGRAIEATEADLETKLGEGEGRLEGEAPRPASIWVEVLGALPDLQANKISPQKYINEN
jgi:hypothetical protein